MGSVQSVDPASSLAGQAERLCHAVSNDSCAKTEPQQLDTFIAADPAVAKTMPRVVDQARLQIVAPRLAAATTVAAVNALAAYPVVTAKLGAQVNDALYRMGKAQLDNCSSFEQLDAFTTTQPDVAKLVKADIAVKRLALTKTALSSVQSLRDIDDLVAKYPLIGTSYGEEVTAAKHAIVQKLADTIDAQLHPSSDVTDALASVADKYGATFTADDAYSYLSDPAIVSVDSTLRDRVRDYTSRDRELHAFADELPAKRRSQLVEMATNLGSKARPADVANAIVKAGLNDNEAALVLGWSHFPATIGYEDGEFVRANLAAPNLDALVAQRVTSLDWWQRIPKAQQFSDFVMLSRDMQGTDDAAPYPIDVHGLVDRVGESYANHDFAMMIAKIQGLAADPSKNSIALSHVGIDIGQELADAIADSRGIQRAVEEARARKLVAMLGSENVERGLTNKNVDVDALGELGLDREYLLANATGWVLGMLGPSYKNDTRDLEPITLATLLNPSSPQVPKYGQYQVGHCNLWWSAEEYIRAHHVRLE